MSGFKIVDNVSDDDIVVSQNAAVGEITDESFREFVTMGQDADQVVYKIKAKDDKARVAELHEFVSQRIIHAVQNGWKTDFIIKHTAKMLTELVHSLGLPALNNAESNALGLWKKAKTAFMRDEVLKHVTALNQSVGVNINGNMLNPDKPRFTTQLFNSLADGVVSEAPPIAFEYKAGRKSEDHRYDDALGFKAIQFCKAEIVKIKSAAKLAKRELTDEERDDVEQLSAKITDLWEKFFVGSKAAIANANKMFPESVGTGRTTTSGVFKSASTYDEINFGVFEL
jgi:hypothetical protein